MSGVIDFERDWAGEARTDPEDGNAYVLREVDGGRSAGYSVRINDIMGGHNRLLPLDTWLSWKKA